MELPKVDRVSSGSGPVVVSIMAGDEPRLHAFDNLAFYETDDTVQLVGSKSSVQIEASDMDSAYSKLIPHLIERAVKAEKELWKLKKAYESGGTTVVLPIESQGIIADEIRNQVLRSFASRHPGQH